MPNRFRTRIYEILEPNKGGDKLSSRVDASIAILILLNVLAVILETVPRFATSYHQFFLYFEIFSVLIFTVEYILRMWSCVSDKQYAGGFKGRLRFFITPMALIDLLAILPFYLSALFLFDLRILRALRLIRFFRIFKLGRYMQSLQIVNNVLKDKKEELVVTLFFLTVTLLIVSALMFFIEHEAQPQAFSSIPAAMWWGIVTLTTVGYGDVYPITAMGRILGAAIALIGVALIALPTSIFSAGMVEELRKKRGNKTCPHCGEKI